MIGSPQPVDLVVLSAAGPLPEGAADAAALPWQCLRLPPLADPANAWQERSGQLLACQPAWQQAPYLLVLDDDVQISAAAVTELFRLMRRFDLGLAQPSLAWQSHFAEALTLHNPCFLLRYTNRLDSAALAFSGPLLRLSLDLLASVPERNALGRVLPACLDDVARGAAVLDAVQVQRTQPVGDTEFTDPTWTGPLRAKGSHQEPATCWGGVGLRNQEVSLFSESREEFLGLLAEGCACAVQEPLPIGEVFLHHFTRSLEPPPQCIQALDAAPAPAALRRSPIVDHRQARKENA